MSVGLFVFALLRLAASTKEFAKEILKGVTDCHALCLARLCHFDVYYGLHALLGSVCEVYVACRSWCHNWRSLGFESGIA